MKRFVVASLAIALVLTLLGPVANADEVTIRIAHWLGDAQHGAPLKRYMDAVQEAVAPYGIKIETVINNTVGYPDQVIMQTAAGIGPDIIFSQPYTYYQLQELLLDLTPYLERDPELNFDSFIPSIWSMFTYGGATKLLPVGVSPYLFFYNEQYFQEAGLTYPDESWTWQDDVPGAMSKLHKAASDGTVERYGLVLEDRLWTPFFSQGGEVLDDGGNPVPLNNPYVAELFEQIYRWYQDNMIPGPANHRPTFASGKGAMYGMMGTFAFPYFADYAEGVQWSFTLPPKGVAGLQIDENLNAWGINIYSQNKDAAWIVLKAMANVSGEITMETLGHFSPVRGKVDAATIAYMQERLGLSPNEVQLALEAVNYVRPRFRHPEAERITSTMEEAFREVAWRGGAAGPAFTNAYEQIRALVSK